MISFKDAQFPKDVILYAAFFYVRYGVSYRDLEEIMVERGVNVDHATLNRWVIRYAPTIALNNIIEQDHRFIKKITKPMMGFKAFHSAQATISGIETAHMIRKGQLSE
jgi:transposase-like protein